MDLKLLFLFLASAGVVLGSRFKRQAARTPLNEAITEPEGRFFDPAFLSMMFSNSGILPSLGSSTMTNAFSALCSYPYIYYYYPMCMGGSGGGMYPPFSPNPSPNFASPSNSYPHFSPGSNGVETVGGPNGYDQPGAGPSFGQNHGPSYNPGHYMNPYAWPSAPNDPSGPGPVPSPSTGSGVDASAGTGGTANSPNGGVQPPSMSGNNPGSSPSSGSGLQPLVPAPFPRMKGYSPRGSPVLTEIPVINTIFPEPIIPSRFGGSPPFAIHPRDSSLLPMKMFGPLTDLRPQNGTLGSTRESQLPANTSWAEIQTAVKLVGKAIIRRGFHRNTTKIFHEFLRVGFKLIDEPGNVHFVGAYLNMTDPEQRLEWSRPANTSCSECFQVIYDSFCNSSVANNVECIQQYFCQAASFLDRTGRKTELQLLETMSAVAGHLLGYYYLEPAAWVIKGVASRMKNETLCHSRLCTVSPDY